MKRLFYTLVLLVSTALGLSAQDAERILGTYITEKGNAKVSITKEGNHYVGTLLWTETPGAKDKNNPEASERHKPLVGKRILTGFVYAGKNIWEDGKIYDPESGKTYSCKITRQSDGSLRVRGFVGVSLLGRTTIWKPVR